MNAGEFCGYCGRTRFNLWHKVPSLDPGVHAFVEPPAPGPQTVGLCLKCGQTNGGNGEHDYAHPFLDPRKPEVSEAYSAGRARGIENERKRCEGIAARLTNEARSAGKAGAAVGKRIADAIAKEITNEA